MIINKYETHVNYEKPNLKFQQHSPPNFNWSELHMQLTAVKDGVADVIRSVR